MLRTPRRLGSWALCTGWLAFTTTTAISHPRYSRIGVLVIAVLCLTLIAALAANRLPTADRRALVAVLAASSVLHLVPYLYYTHMSAVQASVVAMSLFVGMTTLVIGFLRWKQRFDSAAVVIGAGLFLAVSATVLITVPVPPTDVWYIYNQAAGAVFERNIYGMHWAGVWKLGAMGLPQGFVYPPLTAVVMAPLAWLGVDVRWGFLACILGAGLLIGWYARSRGNPSWPLLPLVLWFGPGTLLLTEWGWNEPLLLVAFTGSLIAFERRRPWLGVLLLALAICTKQHVWALLPILAAWPTIGWRRVVMAGGGAVAVAAPWLIADPGLFAHDVLGEHIHHSLRFDSLSLFNLADEFGWVPPFWLSVILIVIVIAGATWAVKSRPSMELPELAMWLAAALAVADLLNKQTFINQYWLVAGLLVLGMTGARVTHDISCKPRPLATATEPPWDSARWSLVRD